LNKESVEKDSRIAFLQKESDEKDLRIAELVKERDLLKTSAHNKDEKIATPEERIGKMQSSSKHSATLLDDHRSGDSTNDTISMKVPAEVTAPECFTKKIHNKKILTGIPNGEEGMKGLCWLISTIQLIFGLGDFMQALYQAWEQTKQTVESEDLLSTKLIKIWIALGYDGKKVAVKKQKLSLLREFRDKLVGSKLHMQQHIARIFEETETDDTDAVQFDAEEAYEDIIDILEDEFKKASWFNLVTWTRTSPTEPTQRNHTILIPAIDYNRGKTTIFDLLDKVLQEDRLGEPSKYLVISYSHYPDKNLGFDLEQPKVLSMKNYFSSTDNTTYKLIGLISHCGDDSLVGHNLAYRLIDGKWYYFNDNEVYEISVCQIGKQYGWNVRGCETAYLAFFEQI
jgi:hypothetical protein